MVASQKLDLAKLLTFKSTKDAKDAKIIAHSENRDVGRVASAHQALLPRLRSSLLSQPTTIKSSIFLYIVQ